MGCVIVHEDLIIGEGYHERYGEAHAEVNALLSVKDKALLTNSSLYVTLEPCSHFGKTPPCADLIVKHKIPRVIICNRDPNPVVNGKGIKKLEDAGVQVDIGILKDLGLELNRRFFTQVQKKRPYITLKWAQTSDGYIARSNFDSKWISNSWSRMNAHRMRAVEDAILIGARTALNDNPRLTVRDWVGKDPLRLLVDKRLSVAAESYLLSDGQPTIIYNTKKNLVDETLEYVKLDEDKFTDGLLSDLNRRKVQSIMVEGGTAMIQQLADEGLWDEAWVFTAPNDFEEGVLAPRIHGKLIHRTNIGDDELKIYFHHKKDLSQNHEKDS